MQIGQFTVEGHSQDLMFVVVKNNLLTVKDFKLFVDNFGKFNPEKYSFTWRES